MQRSPPSLPPSLRLAEAFSRSRWPALEAMVDQGGIEVLLELVQFSPQERYEEVWGATRGEGGPGWY